MSEPDDGPGLRLVQSAAQTQRRRRVACPDCVDLGGDGVWFCARCEQPGEVEVVERVDEPAADATDND